MRSGEGSAGRSLSATCSRRRACSFAEPHLGVGEADGERVSLLQVARVGERDLERGARRRAVAGRAVLGQRDPDLLPPLVVFGAVGQDAQRGGVKRADELAPAPAACSRPSSAAQRAASPSCAAVLDADAREAPPRRPRFERRSRPLVGGQPPPAGAPS